MTMAEEKDDSMPEPPNETFFFGRDPNSIIPRFSRKMLRLLGRYRSRQLYQVERSFNWEKMVKHKPDPNKNHPDDDRKIQEAERNIGDYKLKTGSQYEPQPHETLTYKYKEIVTLRETLHDLIYKFNQRVFQLRNSKRDLYKVIAEKRKRLEEIQQYLPEKNRKYLMEIPALNEDEEWPELNLIEHHQPGCNVDIKNILYLEKKVEDLIPKPPLPKIKPTIAQNALHEMEKYSALHVKDIKEFPVASELMMELQQMPHQSDPGYYAPLKEEDQTSPWLNEIRYRWILDLLVEQDGIIHFIHENIRMFDARLRELEDMRLHTKFEAEFMQSYLIVLNQELYILRDSEQIENQLLNNADAAMKTRNEAQYSINILNRQIEELRKNCDRLNEQILTIQAKFFSTIKGHKFFDFLRRIFKKKWRPPKPTNATDGKSQMNCTTASYNIIAKEDTLFLLSYNKLGNF